MLRLDLKPGDIVRIGDYATITLEDKSGKSARLAFDADRSVPITRVKKPQADNAMSRLGIGLSVKK
jgi:sRNA-binding carbon storage regulator CsrA